MSYEIGQRVKPNPNSNRYRVWESQHQGSTGTITKKEGNWGSDDETWYCIAWDNGDDKHMYPESFLISDEFENPFGTPPEGNPRGKQAEFPIGSRICLNPERSNFEYLNEITDSNTAGYVVYWNNNDILVVQFDNSKRLLIDPSDVLSVDSPPKDVTVYELDDGGRHYVMNGESTEKLDRLIFHGQRKIVEMKIYDDEYRKNLQKSIENS